MPTLLLSGPITAGSNYEEVAQRFNAALAGGDLPDVLVASDVTWFNFALNEATTPLDDLWEMNDIDSESYVDTLREDYKYKDKHYGVPYSRSTNLMYWNTDDLKAAGLPTDRGPKDWEEFDEWATKIKDKLNKPAVTVPDGSSYLDWYFQGMIWAFGGSYSDEWEPNFTSKESIEAGKFLQEQVKAGHIEISTDPTVAFGSGKASGLLESTGSLGGLKETATIPFITTYLPGPGPSAATGGAGLPVPAGISDERRRRVTCRCARTPWTIRKRRSSWRRTRTRRPLSSSSTRTPSRRTMLASSYQAAASVSVVFSIASP